MMPISQRFAACIACICFVLHFSYTFVIDPSFTTSSSSSSDFVNSTLTNSLTNSLERRAFPANFQIKVLPIGDSITAGKGDGYDVTCCTNGYRLELYNLLNAAGLNPKFIGTQSQGTNNPQPNNEGYPGQTIQAIFDNVKNDGILSQQPNLILLHAGTNDNDFDNSSPAPNNPSGVPDRLAAFIDYILCHCPNAVVLVAKIIQNESYNGRSQMFTNAENDAIPGIVGERYMKGFKIRTVDMSMIGGQELATGDTLHPSASTYIEMAERWYSAIEGIPDSWWSTSASAVVGAPIEYCARDSVTFASVGGIAPDTFHANGDTPDSPTTPEKAGWSFTPQWGAGEYVSIGEGYPGSGAILTDLDGDGRIDYIWANYSNGCTIRAWLNGGQAVWNPVNDGNEITLGYTGCSFIEFADLTGDGKPEMIIIADGEFKIWQNGGPVGTIWSWSEMPHSENGINYIFQDAAPLHYWADINGDGKADLIVLNSNTVLDLYLNVGQTSDGAVAYSKCPNIGIAQGSISFADIDGDGKADYISMDSSGGLIGWFNNYTSGCGITWSPINGGGVDSLQLGITADPHGVHLLDWTGDKKADYLVIDDLGNVVLHANEGYTSLADSSGLGGWASAVRLADIDGDGRDDYVSVTMKDGGLAAWLNAGVPNWNELDNGYPIALGYSGATRKQILLADMNADGRDDYLVVDVDTGVLHCYLNNGPGQSGSWNWDILGTISIGVGDGAGVRIADFDGDGRADLIWLDQDGAAKVWLNKGEGNDLEAWHSVNNGAIASWNFGSPRHEIQFVDIDGDGLADYCWIHPDGSIDVWYNLFDGTNVAWSNSYNIPAKGPNGQRVLFGRVGSSGRNDYVAADDGGQLSAWTNQCSVIGTTTRAVAGCGKAPLPTQTTSEPFIPAPRQVSLSDGHTVLGVGGDRVTLPLGITTPSTITTDGTVFTYIAGGNTQQTTITNSAGQVIVQGSLGDQMTLPGGVTGVTTITEANGEVITYNPSPNAPPVIVTSVQGGTTILSESGEVFTIPTGLTTPVTTTTDGVTLTFSPSPPIPPTIATTTDSKGETVLSESGQDVTIPTGLTTPVTTTTNGIVFTFTPDPAPTPTVVTTTDSSGQTVLSESGRAITIPTGITTPITTTTDGITITYTPSSTTTSSSTTLPPGVIIPIFTSVPAPTSTDGGSVVPCKVWFFFFCISWDDRNIGGWGFNIPPGIRPPGPPPPIKFPPELSIKVGITGNLPPWPQITIGPDRIPTFTPSDEPEDCKTESAEICLSSTSTTVSNGVTGSQVISACGTVYGCDVSSESCTQTSTATDYWVSCSTTAPGASSCTTTSSSLTTGCTVTPTTVTCGVMPTAADTPADPACSDTRFEYVVYPQDATNSGQTSSIQASLQQYVEDPSQLSASNVKGIGTIYWIVSLTQDQATDVSQMSNVGGINDYCGSVCSTDATIAMNYQDVGLGYWNFWQLPFISWPRGTSPNPNPSRYFFDSSLGQGETVYVLDTGATLSHPDFDHLQSVRWIQVGEGSEAGEDDPSIITHGTSMLSLIVGWRAGVAKNVNPVIVRTPNRGVGRPFNSEDWLQALGLIYEDLAFDSESATCSVCMAVYFPRDYFTLNGQADQNAADGFEATAQLLLNRLVARGAVLVTGAGNTQLPGSLSDGWPANLGKHSNPRYVSSLMVVGGLDNTGSGLYGRTDLPNGIPHFYAPAKDVTIAEGKMANWGDPIDVEKQYRLFTGTSAATALTAGLSAYFVKLIQSNSLKYSNGALIPLTPQGIKDFISDQNEVVWNRAGNNLNGIWNKANLDQTYCSWAPGQAAKMVRRQQATTCYNPQSTPGNTPSPTVTTIFATSVTIVTTTITSTLTQGHLEIAAVTLDIAEAGHQQSGATDYVMSFMLASATMDFCASETTQVNVVSSTPTAWTNIPPSIFWPSDTFSVPAALSSCGYQNTIDTAGGAEGGGTLTCAGTTITCNLNTGTTVACNDNLATSVATFASCPVSTILMTVTTSSSTVVQTIVSTIGG